MSGKDNLDNTTENIIDTEAETEVVFTETFEGDIPDESVDSIEALKTSLEVERTKSSENLEKALRAQAELDNLRKRTSRDIENAHKFGLEKFINELLPVMDSMELGKNAAQTAESTGEIVEGIELTLKMFVSTMEKHGVEILDPVDQKFDPQYHEAVSIQEVEGKESNTVVSVMQKGYSLNGRLVRPAMVMVAK